MKHRDFEIEGSATGRTIGTGPHFKEQEKGFSRQTLNFSIQAQAANLDNIRRSVLRQLEAEGVRIIEGDGAMCDDTIIMCEASRVEAITTRLMSVMDFASVERQAMATIGHMDVNPLSYAELYGGSPLRIFEKAVQCGRTMDTFRSCKRMFEPDHEATLKDRSTKDKWWERRSEDHQCGNSPTARAREKARARRKR